MATTVSKLSSVTTYISGDITFFLVLFFVLLGYGLYFGRGMIVSLILGFYPAVILYMTFPFTSKLIVFTGGKIELLNNLGVFLLFLIPLVIVIDRYSYTPSEYSGTFGIFRTLAFVLCAIILIVGFSYFVTNYDLLHDFSPKIDSIFATNGAVFYSAVVPLILLAFF